MTGRRIAINAQRGSVGLVVGPVGAVGNGARAALTAAEALAGAVVQAAVGAVGDPVAPPPSAALSRSSTASMAAAASIGPPAARLATGERDLPALPAAARGGDPMHSLLTRHSVHVLRKAGHTLEEVAQLVGVSISTVQRILEEPEVARVDDAAERAARRIGRPSKAEPFREFVVETLGSEPGLMTLELLRRARAKGYDGKKTAFYELVAQIRPPGSKFHMRFEGLPGEFSQHDFGQVDVTFVDGSKQRVHFFASRLKWSRWAAVTIVPDETAETLIRTLLDHFVVFGGVPLCAVFDRPKTVALEWRNDGTITKWNSTFATAALEIGFTAEVCWAYQPQQKGAVEAIVKWVKNSFFKQRRFLDLQDLQQQLDEWLHEINTERPSRATAVIPAERLPEERARLRPPRVGPAELALVEPVTVGPTATAVIDGHAYELPPDLASRTGTSRVYRDRVRIEVGKAAYEFPRGHGSAPTTTPEIRAQRLAGVSGKRGKRYLKRQQILDVGAAAERFLTEVVHADPTGWWRVVDALHDLLQRHGPAALHLALRAAVDIRCFDIDHVTQILGQRRPPLNTPQPSLFGPTGAHP